MAFSGPARANAYGPHTGLLSIALGHMINSLTLYLGPSSTPKSAKNQNSRKIPNFIL